MCSEVEDFTGEGTGEIHGGSSNRSGEERQASGGARAVEYPHPSIGFSAPERVSLARDRRTAVMTAAASRNRTSRGGCLRRRQ